MLKDIKKLKLYSVFSDHNEIQLEINVINFERKKFQIFANERAHF